MSHVWLSTPLTLIVFPLTSCISALMLSIAQRNFSNEFWELPWSMDASALRIAPIKSFMNSCKMSQVNPRAEQHTGEHMMDTRLRPGLGLGACF